MSRALKPGRLVGLRRLGNDLVLWRTERGELACLPDRCCHRAAQLSAGRLVTGCVECPYHGVRYDHAGRVTLIPARGRDKPVPAGFHLASHTVREAHGLVWLWYGPSPEPATALPWDEEITRELCVDRSISVQTAGEFPINYLRIMENSTDLPHVAFVHRRFFGKYTRLDDFSCETAGEHIHVKGTMRPEKAASSSKGFPARVHVFLPCLLIIHAGAKLRFIAAATPIDDNRTWVFARYYQDAVRIPGLGHLLAWMALKLDFWLLQKYQDLPIWQGQRLGDPGDVASYKLFEADKGVASFFRLRRQAIESAGVMLPPRHGVAGAPFRRYGEASLVTLERTAPAPDQHDRRETAG